MTTLLDERDFRRRINHELRWHLVTDRPVIVDQPGVVRLERVTPSVLTEQMQLAVDTRSGTVITHLPTWPERHWLREWVR